MFELDFLNIFKRYNESLASVKYVTSLSAVFCQIPCLNGGRCIGRDQCWCPSNSTGKFCHLPAPVPTKLTTQDHKDADHQGQKPHSHSMYTLPLSNQQGKLPGGPVWQPLLPCWCGILLESRIVTSGEPTGCDLPVLLLSYLPDALNIDRMPAVDESTRETSLFLVPLRIILLHISCFDTHWFMPVVPLQIRFHTSPSPVSEDSLSCSTLPLLANSEGQTILGRLSNGWRRGSRHILLRMLLLSHRSGHKKQSINIVTL